MPQFYVIRGIGGGFDGLVVEGERLDDIPEMVSVTKIVNTDINVGDRTVTLPIPEGALFICSNFLDVSDDPTIREFASDSPYGKFQLEGRMDCGDLRVTYAQFENAMQVNVTDSGTKRTVVSENFLRNFDAVKAAIEDVLKNGDQGGEDLVFKLRELKEAEINGQEI